MSHVFNCMEGQGWKQQINRYNLEGRKKVTPDVSSIKYLGRLVVDPLVGCKAPVFGEINIEPLTTEGVGGVLLRRRSDAPTLLPPRLHREEDQADLTVDEETRMTLNPGLAACSRAARERARWRGGATGEIGRENTRGSSSPR